MIPDNELLMTLIYVDLLEIEIFLQTWCKLNKIRNGSKVVNRVMCE